MHKANIGKKSFIIEDDGDGLKVNGNSFKWDISLNHEGHFLIIHDYKTYRAELNSFDFDQKIMSIKINNQVKDVKIEDKFDLLLEKMGIKAADASKVSAIKAPMPGLILDIMIEEGDTVKKGDPILILEAMKMENIIKSPGDGVVSKLMAHKGESVEKNQVMVQF